MKKFSKFLTVLMALLIIFSSFVPAFADDSPADKEEVIYISLNADGKMKDIYAVNIFPKGNVTDYGNYSSVSLLNTDDTIKQSDDKITFYASADRTYYEGKMKTSVIPWNISIAYYLNGKQYSAKEIAGKSGKLEIRFKITDNEKYCGNIFDNYALQASFTLDTDKCSSISAADATIANVGSDKQLTYTILPGKGIDTTVTADVKDFEMDSVSINGIPLSLNIDVDDKALMDKIKDLLAAIKDTDNGAGKLKNGASDLKISAETDLKSGASAISNGLNKMQTGLANLKNGESAVCGGTNDLQKGSQELYSGVTTLNNGIDLVQKGLNTLGDKTANLTNGSAEIQAALLLIQQRLNNIDISAAQLSELIQGSASIKNGISDLTAGVTELNENVSYSSYKAAMAANGLDIDALQSGNAEMAASLEKQIAILSESGQDTSQLQAILRQLKGNNAAIAGTETYLTQVSGNIGKLENSASTLKEKYSQFDYSVNQLTEKIADMVEQMSELKNGIYEINKKYSEFDSGLNEYTSGVKNSITGYSQIVTGSENVLFGSENLKDGTASLYEKTEELLSGAVKLYNSAGTLKDGSGKLDDGVAALLTGVADLYTGTVDLKDGTGKLRSNTNGMDIEIENKINDMLKSVNGDESSIVSFTSEKNSNVDSLQFVIKTDAVKSAEKSDETTAAKTQLTFWQKLLSLFGLF